MTCFVGTDANGMGEGRASGGAAVVSGSGFDSAAKAGDEIRKTARVAANAVKMPRLTIICIIRT